MNSNLRIAIISGGTSAEASVSRVSAKGVLEALSVNYQHILEMELDTHLANKLQTFNPDLVFPVLHGPPGEDGTLQGFLEILGYSYVGSDVHSSAVAMDKIIAKHIFRAAGLPVIDQITVTRDKSIAESVHAIQQALGSYVVIKPARQGSALGVMRVSNVDEMHEGLENAFQLDPRLLVERRVDGKEITVGVIDTEIGTRAFPVIEITTTSKDSWYDFEHRYTAGLSEHVMPAELTDDQSNRLQEIAIAAHRSLGCRDISRADFIVPDNNTELLLEVNTLPGMTPTSLYPDGARGYGLDFPKLVSYLVERAAARR
ncbi:MAG: D-alanine-D-alanine ligase [Candidatus Azotimanducaceae bacterium]|jgi:D-alanine-D-alanine ligase